MALARSVTVIPARRRTRDVDAEAKEKLKVAAYCRVSTDSEEQATSYEVQVEHYTTYTLPIFRTILNGSWLLFPFLFVILIGILVKEKTFIPSNIWIRKKYTEIFIVSLLFGCPV